MPIDEEAHQAIAEFEATRYKKTKLTRLVPVLLIALGIIQVILAIRVNIGSPQQPGPGMWPMITAVGMIVSGVLVFFTDKAEDYEIWSKRSMVIIAGMFVLALYIPFMLVAGFLIASIILMIVWLRFFAQEAWWVCITVGVGTSVLFYLIFDLLLNVPLPTGLLGA